MEYFENTNRTILGDFLRGVEAGNENVIDIKKAVLPDGKDAVVVCLGNRVLQPEPPKAPERAESPRRAHVFHAMGGFCAYLAQYKTPQTVIFADVGEQTFYAVLDDRASQGFEIVTMVPQLHPLWDPWNDYLGESMKVKDFAHFLLQNRRQLVGDHAKELIVDFSQVRAAAEVTMEAGVGKDCVNSLMIHTKIQGSKRQKTFALPDSFTVRTPLFVGLEPDDIEIDILLEPADLTAGTGVVVAMSSPDSTTKTIAAFEAMCEQVKAEVEGIVVAMGKPDYDPWDYIKARA